MIRDILFLSRDHWEDGWTYGDWRQYIARRPDGALQPCRVSGLPVFLMLLGGFAMFPLMATIFAVLSGVPTDDFVWFRIGVATGVGVTLMLPSIILSMTRWRLMTAVAPRSYNGERHF